MGSEVEIEKVEVTSMNWGVIIFTIGLLGLATIFILLVILLLRSKKNK